MQCSPRTALPSRTLQHRSFPSWTQDGERPVATPKTSDAPSTVSVAGSCAMQPAENLSRADLSATSSENSSGNDIAAPSDDLLQAYEMENGALRDGSTRQLAITCEKPPAAFPRWTPPSAARDAPASDRPTANRWPSQALRSPEDRPSATVFRRCYTRAGTRPMPRERSNEADKCLTAGGFVGLFLLSEGGVEVDKS